MLNPFVVCEIASRLLDPLKTRGFDASRLGKPAGLILEEWRKGLDGERIARAARR